MRYFPILTLSVMCMLVASSVSSNATQQNEDRVLMKNISDLHFQLFSSIQKKTKMIKTVVFETQCSGTGCTFNGCESSGSDTCDGQMFQKLNKIQTSINNIWKKKPKAIDCKSGWKRYNGHCYYLFKTKMNWFDAQFFCRKQRTNMLQINDASENNWVSKAFPNVQYWIDYTDISKEGNWMSFSTGENAFSSWDKGQPNNAGNQDCAVNNFASRRGYWDDYSCFAPAYPVLCEASVCMLGLLSTSSNATQQCDGQLFTKLDKIQSSINNIWKMKPKAVDCKSGWKRYNGHCSYLLRTKMNWSEAQFNIGLTIRTLVNMDVGCRFPPEKMSLQVGAQGNQMVALNIVPRITFKSQLDR